MQAALAKLRAGAKMNEDDRDELLKQLIKARDDLKKGKKKQSQYVLASCEAANLRELPESGGVLDRILSKNAHKDAIQTVFYNPSANNGKGGLTTCVTPKVYSAAMDFINNGGIEAFKDQRTDFYASLLDFNGVWNETMKMMEPFIVGAHYEQKEPVKDKNGNPIMVTGADGNKHQLNSCGAAKAEEECHAKRESLRDPPGSACLWMPNFAHLDGEMKAWYNAEEGPGEAELERLKNQKCVPRADFHLPLRPATETDRKAQHTGKQLKRVSADEKRGMNERGQFVGLGEHSIGKDSIGEDDFFGGAFDITTSLGTRMQVPYTKRMVNGKLTDVQSVKTTLTATDYEEAAKKLQGLHKFSERNQVLPERVKRKIRRIADRNADIYDTAKQRIERENPDMPWSTVREQATKEAANHSKWVAAQDQINYVLYQMAKAKELTKAEVRKLIRHSRIDYGGGTASDLMLCTNDGKDAATVWEGLASKMALEPKQAKVLQQKFHNWRKWTGKDTTTDTKIFDKAYYVTAEGSEEGSEEPGSLEKFLGLQGGGIPLPPANSAAAKDMFIAFDHGPLDVFAPDLRGGAVASSKVGLPIGAQRADSYDANMKKEFKGYKSFTPTKCGGALMVLPSFAVVLLKANPKHYGPIIHDLLKGEMEDKTREADYVDASGKEWHDISPEEYQYMHLLGNLSTSCKEGETQDKWSDMYTHQIMFEEPHGKYGTAQGKAGQKGTGSLKAADASFIEANLMNPQFHTYKNNGGDDFVKLQPIRNILGLSDFNAIKTAANPQSFGYLGFEEGKRYKVVEAGKAHGWYQSTSLSGWNIRKILTFGYLGGRRSMVKDIQDENNKPKSGDMVKGDTFVYNRDSSAFGTAYVSSGLHADWMYKNELQDWKFTITNRSDGDDGKLMNKVFEHSARFDANKVAELVFVQPNIMQRNVAHTKDDGYTPEPARTFDESDGTIKTGTLKNATYHFPVFFARESMIKMLATTRMAGENKENLVLLTYVIGHGVSVPQGQKFLEWMKAKKLLGDGSQKRRILACSDKHGFQVPQYYNFWQSKSNAILQRSANLMPRCNLSKFCASEDYDDAMCNFHAALAHNGAKRPAGFQEGKLKDDGKTPNYDWTAPTADPAHVYHGMFRYFMSHGTSPGYLQDMKKIAQKTIQLLAGDQDPLRKVAVRYSPSAHRLRTDKCGPIGLFYNNGKTQGIVTEYKNDDTFYVKVLGNGADQDNLPYAKNKQYLFGDASQYKRVQTATASSQQTDLSQGEKPAVTPDDDKAAAAVANKAAASAMPDVMRDQNRPNAGQGDDDDDDDDDDDAAFLAEHQKVIDAGIEANKPRSQEEFLSGGGKCKDAKKDMKQMIRKQGEVIKGNINKIKKTEKTVKEFTDATNELMGVIERK